MGAAGDIDIESLMNWPIAKDSPEDTAVLQSEV